LSIKIDFFCATITPHAHTSDRTSWDSNPDRLFYIQFLSLIAETIF